MEGTYNSALLDSLLRQYPEFESQFNPKPDIGWGKYFDETYRTPGQQQRSDAIQAYLAKRFDLDPSTQLTPDQWQEQLMLSQIQNDYAAIAGKGQSVKGAGYLTESPQSAQQNALKYAWEDEMRKRGFNPHAQNATSFAPNQFNAQANVYVDPFVQYGPLGAMREMVRSTTGRHFPGMTDELGITTGPTNYIRPTEGQGQWVQPNEQMPEMPSTRKGIMEKLKQMDTQRQNAVESEMAARQKAQAAQRAAQEKALEKAEAAFKKYQLQLMNKGDYRDYKTGGLNKEGLSRLVLGARIHNTRDWQEAMLLANGDPDLATDYFLKNFRIQWDSAYRKQLQKKQEQQKRVQEEAQTSVEQNRERVKKMVRQYYSPVPLNEPAPPRQPKAISLTPPERLPKFTWQGAKYAPGQEQWPANALPDLIDFLTPPQVKMPWDNRMY